MEKAKDKITLNALELHRQKYDKRLRLHRWNRGLSVSDMLVLANKPRDIKRRRVPANK